MIIVVAAADKEWEALIAGNTDVEWIKADDNFSFLNYPAAHAFIMLQENTNYNFAETIKPVFINSVISTLKELSAPQNVLRINGWNSFLQRTAWEIAGTIDEPAKAIAEKLNKKLVPVKDEPGLIAAKIIAMIINEAYFALGDEVSSKAEIDTAMKLGTNYPYGPFEWSEKIGIQNIFLLLNKLSLSDKRYLPAPALSATQNQ